MRANDSQLSSLHFLYSLSLSLELGIPELAQR